MGQNLGRLAATIHPTEQSQALGMSPLSNRVAPIAGESVPGATLTPKQATARLFEDPDKVILVSLSPPTHSWYQLCSLCLPLPFSPASPVRLGHI